jgi:hypothetical protein
MDFGDAGFWTADWFWGVVLILVTVAFHVVGLMLINRGVVLVLNRAPAGAACEGGRHLFLSIAIMGVVAILATLLHGIEGAIWAQAYRSLGALADDRTAMLYSINAMTSFGHASLFLEARWRMMGALEALNGMLLFGLSTAFLFATMHRLRLFGSS